MKVLVGPRVDPAPDGAAALFCRRLAGDEGQVVQLAAIGVKNPYRPLTAAEVAAIRAALSGEQGTVGYVCAGVAAPGPAGGGSAEPAASTGWIAVTDHVNLTWRSPLTGPNDDRSGPRFPSLHGVYAPESAPVPTQGPESGPQGMIMTHGIVAGVADDHALTGYERGLIARHGWAGASSELVAPVIVAAHLGLRVAAFVMTV